MERVWRSSDVKQLLTGVYNLTEAAADDAIRRMEDAKLMPRLFCFLYFLCGVYSTNAICIIHEKTFVKTSIF